MCENKSVALSNILFHSWKLNIVLWFKTHALAHQPSGEAIKFVCYIFNPLPNSTHSNEYKTKKMCLCTISNLTHNQTFTPWNISTMKQTSSYKLWIYVNGVQLTNPKAIDVIIVSFFKIKLSHNLSHISPYSNKPRALPST